MALLINFHILVIKLFLYKIRLINFLRHRNQRSPCETNFILLVIYRKLTNVGFSYPHHPTNQVVDKLAEQRQ